MNCCVCQQQSLNHPNSSCRLCHECKWSGVKPHYCQICSGDYTCNICMNQDNHTAKVHTLSFRERKPHSGPNHASNQHRHVDKHRKRSGLKKHLARIYDNGKAHSTPKIEIMEQRSLSYTDREVDGYQNSGFDNTVTCKQEHQKHDGRRSSSHGRKHVKIIQAKHHKRYDQLFMIKQSHLELMLQYTVHNYSELITISTHYQVLICKTDIY